MLKSEYRKRKKEAKKEKEKDIELDIYRASTGDVTAVTGRNATEYKKNLIQPQKTKKKGE